MAFSVFEEQCVPTERSMSAQRPSGSAHNGFSGFEMSTPITSGRAKRLVRRCFTRVGNSVLVIRAVSASTFRRTNALVHAINELRDGEVFACQRKVVA
jgi:hypothetical protein